MLRGFDGTNLRGWILHGRESISFKYFRTEHGYELHSLENQYLKNVLMTPPSRLCIRFGVPNFLSVQNFCWRTEHLFRTELFKRNELLWRTELLLLQPKLFVLLKKFVTPKRSSVRFLFFCNAFFRPLFNFFY
jgi:hypothetical protein